MLNINNTWIHEKVVPNLNIQILYMDKAYLESGEDAIIVSNENKPQQIPPEYYYDSNGLIMFRDSTWKYFYFNNSLTPTPYSHTREFTDLFKQSKTVSVYYIPAGTFGAIIKLK